MRDWTFIRAQGRGRFCGVALEVWNPRGAWWGEGDEKFFVDGEKMPSTFGTGTEDYFGYAWCDSRVYEYALHNQTRNDNRNKGHISVNRWHIADSVPFQERFEGCIEKWNPDSHPTLYAAISYWYQEAGIPDPYTPVPSRERSDWYPAATAPAVPGVLEGESMRVVGVTSGHASRTETSGFGPICSDDGVLAWTGGPEGSSLVIRFPAPTEGQYQIQAGLLRAADYGSFRLAVNGRPARNALDLKGEMSVVQVDLGEQELKRKDNSLTVTVVRPGRDASPIAAYLGLGVFGLDYVKLTRVR